MGEYFKVVNLDKGEYLDSISLGMSVKLDGLIASPLPGILVWLLTDGTPLTGNPWMRGSWAGDRVVVAGDEGPSRSVYERAYAEYRDITIEAFEALAADSSYIDFKYEEQGLLDSEGRFVRDWAIGRSIEDSGTPEV